MNLIVSNKIGRRFAVGSIVCLAFLQGTVVWADDAELFQRVAPIFEKRCVSCHNDADRKGGLSLQSAKGLATGGDSGEVVKAGDPAASSLLDMVSGDAPEMPKKAKPLSASEINAIREWIASGAKWNGDVKLRNRALADNDWWSLKPIVRPALPAGKKADGPPARTAIDRFIVAKLDESQLRPSPEADRRTLVRRLYFDLIGLPPSPDEVDQFVAETHPLAYERLVDRLLSSPQYGERWARHWLDVVHYGDTHGYDKDKLRPNAWPYRDYVIRAFNEDRPYQRFVEEQLAGDVLWPDTRDGIVATGFIAAGPWDFIGHAELPETKIDGQIARHLDRDDMVATTMNTFVSLTVQCAQCHNHKFDPVAQENYYSLQAVFAALDRADRQFEPDATIASRRRDLQKQKDDLSAQRQMLEDKVRAMAGPEVVAIDQQLEQLTKQEKAADENPAYGYHSQIMRDADETKWVQVDLGESKAIDQIVFVGCWDAFNNIFHGFGFPPRYKIEISNDPQFQTGVELLLDRTLADVPNPGTRPQNVAAGGKSARFVRFTATRLAPRLNDFIFALAELSVLDANGFNIALGKEVTSLDSIEAPVRWTRKNLVDGYYYGMRSNPHVQATIVKLNGRRDALMASAVSPALRSDLNTNRSALEGVQKQLAAMPPAELVFCGCVYSGTGSFTGTGSKGGEPRPIRILERGNVQKPADPVGPGTVPIIPSVDWRFTLPSGHREGDRRVALVRWITHHDNPLTWRSIVNRVWQYHFGRAIVDSPNDFGRMGQLPTHPEMLDWLAAEFRDGPQSLKDLHRTILLSHAYRQTSSISDSNPQSAILNPQSIDSNPQSAIPNPQSIDSDNRLLWRMNRRKLEAESLRDAVLFVAGNLESTMYGPAYQDFVIERPEHSPHYEYDKYDPDDRRTHRRSVYRFLVRSQPQPFMNTLDCADPSQLVDKRNETLTALQALALLNNKFMVRMSEKFAARLAGEHSELDVQVTAACRLALGRAPTNKERTELVQFAKQFGLTNTCRVILNLNEFAFVD